MVPPIASTRSWRPIRPEPRAGSAPPTPSSRIDKCRVPGAPPLPRHTAPMPRRTQAFFARSTVGRSSKPRWTTPLMLRASSTATVRPVNGALVDQRSSSRVHAKKHRLPGPHRSPDVGAQCGMISTSTGKYCGAPASGGGPPMTSPSAGPSFSSMKRSKASRDSQRS
jgi:hypothetical protein